MGYETNDKGQRVWVSAKEKRLTAVGTRKESNDDGVLKQVGRAAGDLFKSIEERKEERISRKAQWEKEDAEDEEQDKEDWNKEHNPQWTKAGLAKTKAENDSKAKDKADADRTQGYKEESAKQMGFSDYAEAKRFADGGSKRGDDPRTQRDKIAKMKERAGHSPAVEAKKKISPVVPKKANPTRTTGAPDRMKDTRDAIEAAKGDNRPEKPSGFKALFNSNPPADGYRGSVTQPATKEGNARRSAEAQPKVTHRAGTTTTVREIKGQSPESIARTQAARDRDSRLKKEEAEERDASRWR